jgi:hypothetical protein
LRTRQASFVFETSGRGRAGVAGFTRAVNYYAVNSGELPADFVKYEDRHRDGRSRDVESKACVILNYLINNKSQAFYSKDITEALKARNLVKLN